VGGRQHRRAQPERRLGNRSGARACAVTGLNAGCNRGRGGCRP
jgi:hypothetical protein